MRVASIPFPLPGFWLPEAAVARLIARALDIATAAGVLERSAFVPLSGRVLRLEETTFGRGVQLTLWGGAFHDANATRTPDVTIRASLRDFAALALRREDPDTLFFTRRLVIEGDTELGLAMKNALDAADWTRLPAPLRRLAGQP